MTNRKEKYLGENKERSASASLKESENIFLHYITDEFNRTVAVTSSV